MWALACHFFSLGGAKGQYKLGQLMKALLEMEAFGTHGEIEE